MPKDYKDAPAARASSRLSHPLLLGVIIGLLLGIVISLAVALWLNRLSNPFVQKSNRAIEPLPHTGAGPERTQRVDARRCVGAERLHFLIDALVHLGVLPGDLARVHAEHF